MTLFITLFLLGTVVGCTQSDPNPDATRPDSTEEATTKAPETEAPTEEPTEEDTNTFFKPLIVKLLEE